MKKSTIILILAGLVVLLFLKNKKTVGNTYVVIKEIGAGSGYLRDEQGNMIPIQSLVPKVGDIVTGEMKTQFAWNQNITGIDYVIKLGTDETKIIIPAENLKLA